MPSVPIKVPSVGESISEGILARWLKADGASVKAGEPLFELETDKASSVVPAPSSGVLKIGVAEGETVADRRDRRHDRPGRHAGGGRGRPPAPASAAADRRTARQTAPAARRPRRPAGGRRRRSAALAGRPPAGRRGRGRRRPGRRHRARRPRHQGRRAGLPRSTATDGAGAGARSGRSSGHRPPRRAGQARAKTAGSRNPPADERAAPEDRPAAGRGPADRGDPHDLQRSRHVAGHGAARRSTRSRFRRNTGSRWASCRSSSRRRSRP